MVEKQQGSPVRNGTTAQRAARPLRDALRARAFRSTVPLRATIELTKRCNLRCYHCYVVPGSREVPTARWLALLDELLKEGCWGVTLTGGEVGLRDDWLAVARGVKQRRMGLTILTNGTLFDAADLEAIIELHPSRVGVSLYGGDAATHEAVTRVEGSFAKSVGTLRALRAGGIKCQVSSVLMRDNFSEFPGIIELARDMECEFRFEPTVNPRADGSTDVLEHRVTTSELRAFFEHSWVREDTREWRAVKSDVEPRLTPAANCAAGFTMVTFEADGSVMPCIGFGPPFGNITEGPFDSIWRGEAASLHRERMQQPLVECTSCSLAPLCTVRCPRLAQVEDGDVSGRSRRACELAAMVADMRQALRPAP